MSSTAHQDKRHSQRFYSPPSDSSPPPIPLPPTPSSATPLFSSEGTKPTPQRSSYSTGRPRAPPITRSNTAPPLPSNGMAHSPLSPLPRYSPDGNELQSNGHYAKAPLSSPKNEKAGGYFDSRGYSRSESASASPSYNSDYGSSNSSHRSNSPPRRPHLTIAPPKAAFIEPPSSPAFAPPSPRAVDFGDAPRTPRTPKPVVQRDSQMWSRFSMMMHSQQLQEKKDSEKHSAWLDKKTRTKKKFFCLGWIGAILVVGGIIGYVVYHFMTLEKQVEPTLLKLGGFNGEATTSSAIVTASIAADLAASSTTTPSIASTSSSRISSAASILPTTTTSSRAVATTATRSAASTTAVTSRSVSTTTAVARRALFRRHRIPQHH